MFYIFLFNHFSYLFKKIFIWLHIVQVKENREKREAELRKKHEEKQNRKEVQAMAKRLVIKEEKDKHLQLKREEAEIRKEMTKIRKQMQDERHKMDEQKMK